MSRIEELLEEKKKTMDTISPPADMEKRLLRKLNVGNKSKSKILGLVASFILLIFCIDNYSTFAYYGKQILGYEYTMSDDLLRVTESGAGQIIGKSQYLGDGITLHLDAVVLDDNILTVMYRFESDNNMDLSRIEIVDNPKIKGFLTNEYFSYRMIGPNDDGTVISTIGEVENINPLAKRLKFCGTVSIDDKLLDFNIPFTLDRNKAASPVIKSKINKSVDCKGVNVLLDSISATQLSTVIKGEFSYDKIDSLKGDDYTLIDIDISLIIDGKTLEGKGWRNSRKSSKKMTFEIKYEGIEEINNSFELVAESVRLYKDINETISLTDEKPIVYDIQGEMIEILDVYESVGETIVMVKAREGFSLRLSSITGRNKELSYARTEYVDLEEDENDGFHIRNYVYSGTDDELIMNIDCIGYTYEINEEIYTYIK